MTEKKDLEKSMLISDAEEKSPVEPRPRSVLSDLY